MTTRRTDNPRLLAAEALFECFRRGAYGDAELKRRLSEAALPPRDAALASALFYGVLQNRLLLLFYISAYSSVKVKKIHPFLLELICVAAYQIVFMDRIPHSAAVNEAVKLAKETGNARASGFVNGLLRTMAGASPDFPEPPKDSRAGYLSIRYSYPRWMVEELLCEYGEKQAEALLAAGNEAPAVTARINTLQCTAEAAEEELRRENVEAVRFGRIPNFLCLRDTGYVGDLSAYRKGYITIQDPAAALCVLAAAPEPGMRVLDLCAAPGGKTMLAAELMRNQGLVTACDIHEEKVRLIGKNAERMGCTIVSPLLSDAAEYRGDFEEAFDLVMTDVPCSGLGIIRKKPDIRLKDADAVKRLPELQLRILRNAAQYVRPGGSLCYFTCTVRKNENQDITDAFLEQQPAYSPEEFETCGFRSERGMLQTLPHRDEMDGFYLCKMKKSISKR